jgi:hypothetical protein
LVHDTPILGQPNPDCQPSAIILFVVRRLVLKLSHEIHSKSSPWLETTYGQGKMVVDSALPKWPGVH